MLFHYERLMSPSLLLFAMYALAVSFQIHETCDLSTVFDYRNCLYPSGNLT